SSKQMRMLAEIGRKYDKGYAHFTTRQNIQYNWPALKDIPDILEDLASVEMHAIQTSGNCIRNVTADQYAGVSAEEIEDPRIASEILRQWSSFHPEFSFLPRKFKIAVTGQYKDRAAIRFHDIGIEIVKQKDKIGYKIYVGGGQGRTPFIAPCIREFLPKEELLSYMEAIMRVYNLHGRRDNIYKARIKILVHEIGADEMKRQVEEEFSKIAKTGKLTLPKTEMERIATYFAPPPYENIEDEDLTTIKDEGFQQWQQANTAPHKQKGYAIANISLKPIGGIPGDASSEQMDVLAELSEKYGFSEIRVTHEQNLTFPDVKQSALPALYEALKKHGLATANLNMISDIIACPGLDYCNLANTRSIPIAQKISERFAAIDRQFDIGELRIKISGCINACGHHHVGHIGILGVDKKGTEHYQITLGGAPGEDAAIGKIIGRAFPEEEAVDAIEKIIAFYLEKRQDGEPFIKAYRRLGLDAFKEAVYEAA
ncbi:MAG: nitrite/sulfite reductase, partial [Parvibaculales bacterium]